MWTLYLSKQQSQTGCYTTAACFPVEQLKCTTFKDIFPRLSRTLSFNFQNFPGQGNFPGLSTPWNFDEKNPGLSRRHANPEQETKFRLSLGWFFGLVFGVFLGMHPGVSTLIQSLHFTH